MNNVIAFDWLRKIHNDYVRRMVDRIYPYRSMDDLPDITPEGQEELKRILDAEHEPP